MNQSTCTHCKASIKATEGAWYDERGFWHCDSDHAHTPTTKLDLTAQRSTVQLDGAEVTWIKNTEWRERDKKSRVFVWADDESLLDNLVNRTRRPYEAWRVAAIKVLRELGLWDREGDAKTARLRWSQRAGCSCPCSPGFVIDSPGRTTFRGGDIHIHIKGIPTVDETKPARELV